MFKKYHNDIYIFSLKMQIKEKKNGQISRWELDSGIFSWINLYVI